MTSGTDRARELLRRAIQFSEPGSEAVGRKAIEDIRDRPMALLDLAIKQHESLRGEHAAYLATREGNTFHWRAVAYRNYAEMPRNCPECLVLLQWEQMWEEKKQ